MWFSLGKKSDIKRVFSKGMLIHTRFLKCYFISDNNDFKLAVIVKKNLGMQLKGIFLGAESVVYA